MPVLRKTPTVAGELRVCNNDIGFAVAINIGCRHRIWLTASCIDRLSREGTVNLCWRRTPTLFESHSLRQGCRFCCRYWHRLLLPSPLGSRHLHISFERRITHCIQLFEKQNNCSTFHLITANLWIWDRPLDDFNTLARRICYRDRRDRGALRHVPSRLR